MGEVPRVDIAIAAVFEVSGVRIKVTHVDWDPISLGQMKNRRGNEKKRTLGVVVEEEGEILGVAAAVAVGCEVNASIKDVVVDWNPLRP
jgi:hypothetical protein